MDTKPDLEALKQALADAKAIHRDAACAVLDAKRVADNARWNVNEARRAYNVARNPNAKRWSRPARTEDLDPDWPFASEEVA